jgi:hypothetical protein
VDADVRRGRQVRCGQGGEQHAFRSELDPLAAVVKGLPAGGPDAVAAREGRRVGVDDGRHTRARPVGHLHEALLRLDPRSSARDVPLLGRLQVADDERPLGAFRLLDEIVVADRLDLQRGDALQRGLAAEGIDRFRDQRARRINARRLRSGSEKHAKQAH